MQDKHAMRVLPGFDENAKIKLLHKMKNQVEIIICIYSGDITTNKTRQDFGITYDLEVLRLIDTFRKYDMEINSVVFRRWISSSTGWRTEASGRIATGSPKVILPMWTPSSAMRVMEPIRT